MGEEKNLDSTIVRGCVTDEPLVLERVTTKIDEAPDVYDTYTRSD